jgi:hypothetical protein
VFEKISSHVRCTHAWLDNAETAPEDIDVTWLSTLSILHWSR